MLPIILSFEKTEEVAPYPDIEHVLTFPYYGKNKNIEAIW